MTENNNIQKHMLTPIYILKKAVGSLKKSISLINFYPNQLKYESTQIKKIDIKETYHSQYQKEPGKHRYTLKISIIPNRKPKKCTHFLIHMTKQC